LIKNSFQGLSVAIKTIRIVKELIKIWPNEVCDTNPSFYPVLPYESLFSHTSVNKKRKEKKKKNNNQKLKGKEKGKKYKY